jgi:hypothetical protein
VQSLCGSVRQCDAIDVWVSTLIHRDTSQNGDFVTVERQCVAVRQSMAVRQCVAVRAAVCGSVAVVCDSQCVQQCAAVRQCGSAAVRQSVW